jgi:carboxypeptidase Taq
LTRADPVAELDRRFARLAALSDATGILDWDSQTMMPEGAAHGREEQLATLRGLHHEMLSAPDLDDLLDAAQAGVAPGAPAWLSANLREMRRDRVHATAVPPDLVEANSRAVSRCEGLWRTARPANDFAGLRPALEEVLRLQREIAAAKASRLGVSPYDALLDQFEPDGRAADVDILFADLARFLPGFIAEVLEHQASQPPALPLEGPFPVEAQRNLGLDLMRTVGFDDRRGRLDVSLHPFCGGATGDIRITTRYDTADFTRALMGVLHETGHAMYEQNRPAEHLRRPIGRARGMTMHESQSLIVEMQACRSRPFVGWLASRVAAAFGRSGPAWTPENLVRLYTRVERSLIRVYADEVTYPAHVILRYRLERAMIGGDLTIADLPGAWAEAMRDLVGAVPPDDRTGCLQDIHWPAGLFGYFPCYTLGAMTAAQLFEAACRADPTIPSALGRGEFAPLMGWLRTNVHVRGATADTRTIVADATSRPLDATAFEAHLRRRYLDVR